MSNQVEESDFKERLTGLIVALEESVDREFINYKIKRDVWNGAHILDKVEFLGLLYLTFPEIRNVEEAHRRLDAYHRMEPYVN